MCPPDPIVVTVDIVNSPSPLIGSATIKSVASTSEAIQLVTQGPKGDTGPTVLGGITGSVQFRYGSGLSASNYFYTAPVDPLYETPYTAIPSQPSYTDCLYLVAATAQNADYTEITPVGLAFHRHLYGGFDDTGGSVVEAVGTLYDQQQGFVVGNNLILRPSPEGDTGHKGHLRFLDAYQTIAYEVSNDDTGSLYHDFFGDLIVFNSDIQFAAGYGVTFQGPITAPNIVYSVNGAAGAIQNVAKTNIAQSFVGTQGFANGIFITGGATFAFPDTVTMLGNVVINKDGSRTLTVNGDANFNGNTTSIKGIQVTNNARNWYFT